MPGSASDKPLCWSDRSGRLCPCCSSHFQYSAPLIQFPLHSGQLKSVRPASRSVARSSGDLQTGHFMTTLSFVPMELVCITKNQLLALLKMRNSFAGVLSSVGTGNHRHHFANNSIPDEIRKMMDNCPADISINDLVDMRILCKSIKNLRNFGKELGTEAASLSLVPKLRFGNLKLGGATDLNIEAQRISRSSRVFTSGQGLWSSGLVSTSSNRASSKARSASVTGRSSGVSVSQTAPISSKRSAGLRLATFANSDSSIMH